MAKGECELGGDCFESCFNTWIAESTLKHLVTCRQMPRLFLILRTAKAQIHFHNHSFVYLSIHQFIIFCIKLAYKDCFPILWWLARNLLLWLYKTKISLQLLAIHFFVFRSEELRTPYFGLETKGNSRQAVLGLRHPEREPELPSAGRSLELSWTCVREPLTCWREKLW